MAALAGSGDRLAKEAAELSANVQRFKEESAQEVMEVRILCVFLFQPILKTWSAGLIDNAPS
jgi:hypothetical protein